LLRQNGIEPEIVLYLETPPDAKLIAAILRKLKMQARELLRKGQPEYAEMGLADPHLGDDQLIAAMVQAPVLIERPIVLANGKARIGRPPEAVLQIL